MAGPDSVEPTGTPAAPVTAAAATLDSKAAPASTAAPAAPHPALKAPEMVSAHRRRWWIWIAAAALILFAVIEGLPWLVTALTTVSTDDAYVNGHVTFVAPRVAGQVARVLVDDNNRVRTGDLLVQLDKEPFEVQVSIAQAAVATAQADLVAAQAQVRGIMGLARSQRFNLQHAIEDLDDHVAELQSRVATLESQKATLTRARADYEREKPLVNQGAVSKKEFDRVTEALSVAEAQFEKAQQDVYQVRAGLGLPRKPGEGDDLAAVPADLDQTFSAVKEAQFRLMQTAAQLGVTYSFDMSPKQMLADFYKRDPEGNIDRIFAQLLKDAPAVKQAEAKLGEAQSNLDPGEAESPLLRRGGGDRRRGDAAQRQSRRPRRRRASDDGGALADRDLGRRQLQGERSWRSCASASRGPRCRHVRRQETLSGAHLRLHDGNRLDAGAAAGGECDRQLREGRAAPAGADRAAGL